MGNRSSVPAPEPLNDNVPDASLSSNIITAEENARKKKQYAHLQSAVVGQKGHAFFFGASSERAHAADVNVIEQVYNEDFETIDHIQAMRFPPYVAKQIKDAVRNESERRCAEMEKTMARCLQDKMWTSWKCQKERDAYYYCVEDEERRNSNPRRPEELLQGGHDAASPAITDSVGANCSSAVATTAPATATAAATAAVPAERDDSVDLLTAYRWKFNLGVLHGEIVARNNIMRQLWREHFPDRDLPHPWVKDEE